MAHLSSITSTPKVVYPGINIEAYQAPIDWAAPDVDQINSEQPTLISLNRFEMKKNAALAIEAFALLRDKASTQHLTRNMRLVLAGGYDPRLEDNIRTLNGLVERARSSKLSFNVITPLQSTTTTTTTARTLKQERGRGRHVAALSCQRRRRRCVATTTTTTMPPCRRRRHHHRASTETKTTTTTTTTTTTLCRHHHCASTSTATTAQWHDLCH
ncbi:hypothetical protein EV363DRAFT_1340675 [Boletus edulis]|nr:hypothetical protein EV363DRAFT_1340675 [Boletus edulis]